MQLSDGLKSELTETATTALENIEVFLGNLQQVPHEILIRYARRLQLAATLIEVVQEKAWAAWERGEQSADEIDPNSDAFADHEDDETAWQRHVEAFEGIE
jgi:hypothetical protein